MNENKSKKENELNDIRAAAISRVREWIPGEYASEDFEERRNATIQFLTALSDDAVADWKWIATRNGIGLINYYEDNDGKKNE